MSPNKLPLVLEKKVVFQEHFLVEKSRLQVAPSPPYDYYTLVTTSPIAVMVLATTAEGAYVLNWEYRPPTQKVLLSCPGGLLDPGETPLEAAARELREETGYEAAHFSLLGESYPLPGVCTQKTIFVQAREAHRGGAPRREATEYILETLLLSPEALRAMIQRESSPEETRQKNAALPLGIDGLLLSALALATFMKSG